MEWNRWHYSPSWLRALAIDAQIYGDIALAEMAARAIDGDVAAVALCRKEAERIAE